VVDSYLRVDYFVLPNGAVIDKGSRQRKSFASSSRAVRKGPESRERLEQKGKSRLGELKFEIKKKIRGARKKVLARIPTLEILSGGSITSRKVKEEVVSTSA